MSANKKSAVTLFVMVKNEERCISRCLKSASHLVDEIVVLDTGSSDATVEIAKRDGATVYLTDWPNDFAVARNIGLAQIKTPWVLMLDADEWVQSFDDSGGGFALDLQASSCVYEVGMQMLCFDDAPASSRTINPIFWTPRVFPSELRYVNSIHEQLVHQLPISRLPLLLGHDGYEPEQQKNKSSRNLPLLLTSLEKSPGDGMLYYYIAQELRATPESSEESILFYFDTSIRLIAPSNPLREIVLREALSYLKERSAFERGFRLILEALESRSLSAELSYASGDFLCSAAEKNCGIDPSLLLSVAENMFERVIVCEDKPSSYFAINCDLKELSCFRLSQMRLA